MMFCEICIFACSIFWPFGATAFSTTSRPPCRSRPCLTLFFAGEPGTAITKTPASASRIRPSSRRYLRRSVIRRLGRVAAVARFPRVFPGVFLAVFLGIFLDVLQEPGDRVPRHPHLEPVGDLDVEDVAVDGLHRSVEAAGRD